jgi:peroxiredoxin
VAQLRQSKDEFDAAGARVLLVGMGTMDQTAAFIRQLEVPFPMACDPQRRAYSAFALKRMSPLGFLSPGLAVKALAAVSRGHAMGVPQGDIRQLAGLFVIDARGEIIHRHEARDPSDHLEPAAIITLLQRAAGESHLKSTDR